MASSLISQSILKRSKDKLRQQAVILRREILPPDENKFRVLKTIALVGDLFGIASTLGIWTVLVPIVLNIVDVFFNIYLIFSLGVTAKKIKKNVDIVGNARETLSEVRTNYTRILRITRKIPGLRRLSRRIALKIRNVRRKVINTIATRQIMGRQIGNMIASLIPIVELWPWRYRGIKKLEQQEMEAYQQVLDAQKEVAEELETANELEQEQQQIQEYEQETENDTAQELET